MERYNLLKNKENIKSTEVKAETGRRSYAAAYKKKVVEEALKCSKPGELGSLLRREGLRSSTLHNWRIAYANCDIRGTKSIRRGPGAELSNTQKEKLLSLEKENYVLKRKLEKAEALVELQKKIAEILSLREEERI
jgi:hypothetical protein